MHIAFCSRVPTAVVVVVCFSILAATCPLPAQEVSLTGKPWIDMNYGRSLTLSLEAGKDNFAYKGIAVRLDEGEGGISRGEEFAIFDTDTLRMAAGWRGEGFINWQCIHFDGRHAIHPKLVGQTIVTNPPAPGWARPDSHDFTEDRVIGRDGKHYGPLPRDWAHFKGHYLHGDDVVFSYTVGDTQVLESPATETAGGLRAITRTLNINSHSEELVLQVAHNPAAEISQQTAESARSDAAFVVVAPPTANENEDRQSRDAELDNGEDEREEEEDEENDVDELIEQPDEGVRFDGHFAGIVRDAKAFDMTKDYTIWATIDTDHTGTIFAKAPVEGEWAPGGKVLFTVEGQLVFDVGWVGMVHTEDVDISDGELHEVAATYTAKTETLRLYVDGELAAERELESGESDKEFAVKLGFATPDFPEGNSAYHGFLGQARFYNRALDAKEIAAVGKPKEIAGLVAHWDRIRQNRIVDRAGKHHARITKVEQFEFEEDGDEEQANASPSVPMGDVLCVGLVDAPAGCRWVTTADGNVRLVIPPSETPSRIKIAYGGVETTEDTTAFAGYLASAAPARVLKLLTRGGPNQWQEESSTKTSIIGDKDAPFVAQTVTVPHENPYRSWMRLGGFDFFEGGDRAAVCTWQGDVWLVDGIGDTSDDAKFTWTRIASGMFQPLGLKIVDGAIYVTCRDQITILRDLNGDGMTDFYENFNNDAQVTDHFHEFAVGLQTDANGDFYYAKCARHALDALVPQHGTLLRVSKDGSTTEIIARGYRAPNGVCVNDDGTFFLSDQEGHWTPKNRINWVKPGGFYGNMMAYHNGRPASDFEPPVCWIHNNYDRSPAEQIWVASDKWGPLAGSLLTLSYGTGEIHLVLHEIVDGVMQGGLVKMPITDFPTGTMRGRFHPQDGQLYACGLFGWSSNKTSPGGFYRIRYSGKPLHMPKQLQATQEGLTITFTDPLDASTVEDYRNWSAQRWQYRRTQNYGSDDYRISESRRRGRDRVRIESVKLSDDKRTVQVEIRDMKPAMQMELRCQIKSADGAKVARLIHHTVHRLPNASTVSGGR